MKAAAAVSGAVAGGRTTCQIQRDGENAEEGKIQCV